MPPARGPSELRGPLLPWGASLAEAPPASGERASWPAAAAAAELSHCPAAGAAAAADVAAAAGGGGVAAAAAAGSCDDWLTKLAMRPGDAVPSARVLFIAAGADCCRGVSNVGVVGSTTGSAAAAAAGAGCGSAPAPAPLPLSCTGAATDVIESAPGHSFCA